MFLPILLLSFQVMAAYNLPICYQESFEGLASDLTDFESYVHQARPSLGRIYNFRPRKCPFINSDPKDVYREIKEVANQINKGKCGEKQAKVFDSIHSGVDDMNNAFFSSYMNRGRNNMIQKIHGTGRKSKMVGSKEMASTLMAANSGQILLNTFQNVMKDPDCMENVRKPSVMGKMASVITNVSKTGFYAPSEHGNTAAMGGAMIGTALQLFDTLFSSDFDWSSQKDRETFVQLNCSYYELRRELDENYLVDVTGIYTAADKEKLDRLIEDMETRVYDLEEKFRSNMTDLEEERRRFIMQALGDDIFKRREHLLALSNELDITLNPEDFLMQLVSIGEMFDRNSKFYLSQDNDFRYGNEMIAHLLSPQNFETLSTYSIAQVNEQVLIPLQTNIGGTLDFIEARIDSANENWGYQESFVVGQNINDYVQNLSQKFETSRNDSVRILSQLKRKRNLMNKNSLSFTDSDDGSSVLFDVFDEHRQMHKKIIGKDGWSFYKYLLKLAEKSGDVFDRQLKRFVKKYDGSFFLELNFTQNDELKRTRKDEACAEAKAIGIVYQSYNIPLEEARDFLYTNRGLFTSLNDQMVKSRSVEKPELTVPTFKDGSFEGGSFKTLDVFKSSDAISDLFYKEFVDVENLSGGDIDYRSDRKYSLARQLAKREKRIAKSALLTQITSQLQCN